jgi:soluble lytic murein transglycosylase-like protein
VYFPKVKHLLNDASHRILKDAERNPDDLSFFTNLALAVAWQESCFRQFIVKDEKVVFLRSYNGSSVGLMQVNERVWRGLYDLYALRWDIRYNAQAGCEILDLYLRQYALPEVDARDARYKDTLARLVYALYNGGPGQLPKFKHRHKKEKYFLSDRLFYEKYRWVIQDAWGELGQCLTES